MKSNYTYTTPANFLGYMVTHPNKWYDYITKCALTKKTSFDQELPWLSLDAIENLESRLTKNMSVLEFGGGGSTLYFAKRAKHVTCVETDATWVNILYASLQKRGIENVDILQKPFVATNEDDLRQSDYIQTLPEKKFDLILVDGPEIQKFKARPVCFEWAEKHIKPGGIIVVDDAWRYESLHHAHHAVLFEEFAGIGPGRSGMTKTDIYFY